MLRNFAIAVVSGIFLVLAVLILLYRKIIPPFVNTGSLLLAPLGGPIPLLIAGYPLSLPVFIGILMLPGIVWKKSLLPIDFSLQPMAQAAPRDPPILDAGPNRSPPIPNTPLPRAPRLPPTSPT